MNINRRKVPKRIAQTIKITNERQVGVRYETRVTSMTNQAVSVYLSVDDWAKVLQELAALRVNL